MITFRETLDGLRNASESMRGALLAEASVVRAVAGLKDLRSMLEAPRIRKGSEAAEVIQYLDRVVLPQLIGVYDALQVGTDDSFKRLHSASEQVERLILRLQMLVDGTVDGLL